jgi:hypothetical protein
MPMYFEFRNFSTSRCVGRKRGGVLINSDASHFRQHYIDTASRRRVNVCKINEALAVTHRPTASRS